MSRYCINGIEMPSVTEILGIMDKPALVQWAANQATEYIKQNYSKDSDINDLCQKARFEYKNVPFQYCANDMTIKECNEYIKYRLENYVGK